jgi:predicted 2-oxoglutarate/Fe(II)-dependent dioxygenase YbiX
MDKNLANYVRILPEFIDKNSCNKILEQINYVDGWEQHTYHDPKTDTQNAVNSERELDVNWNVDKIPTANFLHQRVADAAQEYLKSLNFYWYQNYQAFSKIRFNRYNENCIMNTHVDHIHTLFEGKDRGIPVLSVLGALNDDFEGGEFVLFNDTSIKLPQGSIIIFPSNFLYPHKVDPVKKGTRYTFVSWVW